MSAQQFIQVGIGALTESPNNPRKSFDAKFLKELEASIREKGIINPLVVRSNGAGPGHYEILAGANRFRAARAVGLKEIPVIVHEMDDRAAMELMLLDNLQRADVHPLEEARGYKALIAMAPGAIRAEDIAAKIGKSKEYVYARLKLLDLAPEAQKAFAAGKFSAGHAVILARLDADEQKELLEYVSDGAGEIITVRDLEREIKWKREVEKRAAERKVEDAKRKAEAKTHPAKMDDWRAAQERRRKAEIAKVEAERIARVATVDAILAKVAWPIPRPVLEAAFARRLNVGSKKLTDGLFARAFVEQVIFAGYKQDYYFDVGGSIAKIAKLYGVDVVKPKIAAAEREEDSLKAAAARQGVPVPRNSAKKRAAKKRSKKK